MTNNNTSTPPVVLNPRTPAQIYEARSKMLDRILRGCPPHIAAKAEGVDENWEDDRSFAEQVERHEYVSIAERCEAHYLATNTESAQMAFFLKTRAGLVESSDGFHQKVSIVPETVDGTQPPAEPPKA